MIHPVSLVDFLRSRRNTKWSHYGPDVIPAWVADMDFGAAPAIQAAMVRLVADQDYGYAERSGNSPERAVAAAFSDHMQDLYGWRPDEDLIVPLPDLVQAVLTSILAFTDRGAGVAMALPAYPPFITGVADVERRLLAIPMVDDGVRWALDVARLESVARQAEILLICNPHNPTGRVFTRRELSEIARIAIEHELIIVCDEVHSELVYPGQVHIPMAMVSPDVAQRTVTITSATKSFNVAGLRCAVMHFGAPGLYERYRRRFPDGVLGHLSVFAVDATIAAWAEGAAWLQETLDKLNVNRQLLTQVLAAELPQIGYHQPEATYLAWLDLTACDLRQSPWAYLLETAGLVTTAGEEFGDAYGAFARVNFATELELFGEMLTRLSSALKAGCQ